jgi:hypothetical protein
VFRIPLVAPAQYHLRTFEYRDFMFKEGTHNDDEELLPGSL